MAGVRGGSNMTMENTIGEIAAIRIDADTVRIRFHGTDRGERFDGIDLGELKLRPGTLEYYDFQSADQLGEGLVCGGSLEFCYQAICRRLAARWFGGA